MATVSGSLPTSTFRSVFEASAEHADPLFWFFTGDHGVELREQYRPDELPEALQLILRARTQAEKAGLNLIESDYRKAIRVFIRPFLEYANSLEVEEQKLLTRDLRLWEHSWPLRDYVEHGLPKEHELQPGYVPILNWSSPPDEIVSNPVEVEHETKLMEVLARFLTSPEEVQKIEQILPVLPNLENGKSDSVETLHYQKAFTPRTFTTAREFLDYYNPNRAISLHDYGWEYEQSIAVEMYSSFSSKDFLHLNPTVEEIREFLEIPLMFGRGQLHEPPSGPLILKTLFEVGSAGFASIKNLDEWKYLTTFKTLPAAEWESLKSGLITKHLEVLIGFGPSIEELKFLQTYDTANNRYLSQYFLKGLMGIHREQSPMEQVTTLIQNLERISTLHQEREHRLFKPLPPCFSFDYSELLRKYAFAQVENLEGISEKESQALTNRIKKTRASAFRLAINEVGLWIARMWDRLT